MTGRAGPCAPAPAWEEAVGADVVALLAAHDQRVVSSLAKLAELVADVEPRRLLLVQDTVAVTACAAADPLAEALAGFEVRVFDAFTPNPRIEDAIQAARAAAEYNAAAVVACGGGSCLDVAKVAALGARAPERAADFARGRQLDRAHPLPLFAIPTTSGTGSEATHFAAVYADGRKVSVAHPQLRPRGVVLDVALHLAMPPDLAAITGMDALGQAMESLWAVGGSPASALFAEAAGALITRYLVPSARRATEAARVGMMLGAHLAGQAINLSKTTAAHALSYRLTQQFSLAHGLAVALTLGHVGRANAAVTEADCLDPRGPVHVREQVAKAAAWLAVEPATLPAAVEELLRELNLPATLAEAGVGPAVLPELATAVDPLRLSNNPRRLDTPALIALLEQAAVSAGPTPTSRRAARS